MPWQRRLFKGNKVFARTDAQGNLLDTDGRVEIRYKLTDPRAYQAAAVNLKKLGAGEGDALLPDEEAVPGVEPARTAPKPAAGSEAVAGRARVTGSGVNGTEASQGSVSSATGRASDVPNASAYGQPSSAFGAANRPGSARAPVGGTSTTRMVKSGGHSPSPPFLEDREPVIIYTDGACSGNPGPAGIGVVMTCGGQRKELSEYLGQGTSNIAELTAIKRALEQVKDTRRTVLLYLDSQYSLGVLNGWKVKANQGLVDSIKREMERFEDLRFIKVPGHAGIPENERCDQLARDAVSRGR